MQARPSHSEVSSWFADRHLFQQELGPHPAALGCVRVCVKGDNDLAQSPGVLLSAVCNSGNKETKAECIKGCIYLGILALQEGHSSKV